MKLSFSNLGPIAPLIGVAFIVSAVVISRRLMALSPSADELKAISNNSALNKAVPI
jgi:hypothetical protein